MLDVKRTKNYRGKCVICGDATVGKSALTQVFCSDGSQYPKTYSMTTGVDMVVKNVNIPDTPDIVEMFLYDSAGKDVFEDIVDHHIDNAEMAMLVYDVSCAESFKNITNWHKKVESNGRNVPCVLVANKVDLESRRVVSKGDGGLLAGKLNVPYFECSAKESDKVDVPFLHLAASFYEQLTKAAIQ